MAAELRGSGAPARRRRGDLADGRGRGDGRARRARARRARGGRGGARLAKIPGRPGLEQDDLRTRSSSRSAPAPAGDEATLFAADLFRIYQRFCEAHRWKVEVLESQASEVGGFKEIIFGVEGPSVWRMLRFESGGHRVQRVPATETQGRIHTSAATVAVLPEAEEVDTRRPRRGPAHRHDARRRGGRPARQQDRVRGAHHAPADGCSARPEDTMGTRATSASPTYPGSARGNPAPETIIWAPPAREARTASS